MSGLLAKMEAHGIAFDSHILYSHQGHVYRRLGAIHAAAQALLGHDINLSSAQQLSVALYEELELPPPTVTTNRGVAKTHTPTDETSLRQLAHRHPLPDLVLEHRCLSNIASKWLEPEWVVDAA